MTKASAEAGSWFPVPCFTGGSEAAKPNIFGIESHCHHLPLYTKPYPPLVSLSFLSTPLKLLLPYSHLRFKLSCPAQLLGAARQMEIPSWWVWGMQQLKPCSTPCFGFAFGLGVPGDLPIETREDSCSSQQISELAENSQGGLVRL